jgi:hypothetical protein
MWTDNSNLREDERPLARLVGIGRGVNSKGAR